jgi:uncharacterized membrane protein
MENKELKKIKKDLNEIKEILKPKEPKHFSKRHIITAFIGSLIIGQTFALKGLLYTVAYNLTKIHLLLIILATILILTIEIHFIGYSRLKKRKNRHFFQFWLKRIITYAIVAIIVSIGLVFLHNMNTTIIDTIKIITVLGFPCAVGASLSDLLERY